MALKNFTQFTPYTVLSATDNFVGYRDLDEIRSDLSSVTNAISGLLISKGFTPGSSVGVVRKVSYRYTIASGSSLNSVSGADDYGLVLSYQPTQVEVYRNGAHLAEILDFVATNGNQITNLSALNTGDIVEVVALSSTVLNLVGSISGSGDALASVFRYSVATSNTIKPGNTLIAGVDDFGSSLGFTVPNLEVYLNGSHLVRDLDYGSYNSGTALTLNEAVADGDTVEVVTISAYNLSQVVGISSYAGIQQIRAGKDFYISNITGTGSVTLSSKPGIRDIKVPDWTTGGHITNWSTLQSYLSSVASSNRFTQASASYVELIPTNFAVGAYPVYFGGTLAPNGKIYFIPYTTSVFSFIDPSNNTITTFATYAATTGNYEGGVLHPNGKIYVIPHSNSLVRVIDPSTNTVSVFRTLINFIANGNFSGGTLAPNGRIYFAPYYQSCFTFIDPDSNTISTFGTFAGVLGNYLGAALAPNGKIYFGNFGNSLVRVVDPSNNTVNVVATITSSSFAGPVLAPNGKIFLMPYLTNTGAVINTANDSVSTIPNFAGDSICGALSPNGKIYLAPGNNATRGQFIDPETNVVGTYLSTFNGAQQYSGAVLGPNGKIFFIPHNATSIGVLNFLNNNNFNINVCTNPMFNKL